MPTRLDVNVVQRSFSVKTGSQTRKFAIPKDVDLRVSDLRQILQSALQACGAAESDWWILSHDKSAEPKEFLTSRFALTHTGPKVLPPARIECMFLGDGLREGSGYRGAAEEDLDDQENEDEEFEFSDDDLGGIWCDQEMRDSFTSDLYWTEKLAAKAGYSPEGPWLLRALDHETGSIVQCFRPATWQMPPRWKPEPLN